MQNTLLYIMNMKYILLIIALLNFEHTAHAMMRRAKPAFQMYNRITHHIQPLCHQQQIRSQSHYQSPVPEYFEMIKNSLRMMQKSTVTEQLPIEETAPARGEIVDYNAQRDEQAVYLIVMTRVVHDILVKKGEWPFDFLDDACWEIWQADIKPMLNNPKFNTKVYRLNGETVGFVIYNITQQKFLKFFPQTKRVYLLASHNGDSDIESVLLQAAVNEIN